MSQEEDKGNSQSISTVDSRVIHKLYAEGLLSSGARDYALNLVAPPLRWGRWTSNLLLGLGSLLIIAGIICFFAFNWEEMSQEVKFGIIQGGLFVCLCGVLWAGLRGLHGKILLSCASVLVGVFLAVFGQVYQTGADAYSLFMMWAALILPWVLISEFGVLWLIWLIISNTFLILYWNQAATVGAEWRMMIFSYLALFNGLFLALKEIFASQGRLWLQGRLLRIPLALTILVCTLIPTLSLIFSPREASHSVIFGVILAVIAHVSFYWVYRFVLPDLPMLAISMLSACIITESLFFELLDEILLSKGAGLWFLMGVFTLGLFTLAVFVLRFISKQMEEHHESA